MSKYAKFVLQKLQIHTKRDTTIEVPPDNNASERAIRNVKVKQKISGQFKKEQSAQNFAKIRLIIDTTIKNGLNVLDGISLIAKFEFQFID